MARSNGCTCGKYKHHDLTCPALPMDQFLEKFAEELHGAVSRAASADKYNNKGTGEKGACPSCPKIVALRVDGNVWKHRNSETKTTCAGSYRRPL